MENIDFAGIGYLTIVCKVTLHTNILGDRRQAVTVTVFDDSLRLQLGRISRLFVDERVDLNLTADRVLESYLVRYNDSIRAYNAIRALKPVMPKYAANVLFSLLARIHLFG